MTVKWTRYWVTKFGHQMALLSAMLKGAKTINRWCPSQLQIWIWWLSCFIWSQFDDIWWRRRRRRKMTYRPAAGFAAGKKQHLKHLIHSWWNFYIVRGHKFELYVLLSDGAADSRRSNTAPSASATTAVFVVVIGVAAEPLRDSRLGVRRPIPAQLGRLSLLQRVRER